MHKSVSSGGSTLSQQDIQAALERGALVSSDLQKGSVVEKRTRKYAWIKRAKAWGAYKEYRLDHVVEAMHGAKQEIPEDVQKKFLTSRNFKKVLPALLKVAREGKAALTPELLRKIQAAQFRLIVPGEKVSGNAAETAWNNVKQYWLNTITPATQQAFLDAVRGEQKSILPLSFFVPSASCSSEEKKECWGILLTQLLERGHKSSLGKPELWEKWEKIFQQHHNESECKEKFLEFARANAGEMPLEALLPPADFTEEEKRPYLDLWHAQVLARAEQERSPMMQEQFWKEWRKMCGKEPQLCEGCFREITERYAATMPLEVLVPPTEFSQGAKEAALAIWDGQVQTRADQVKQKDKGEFWKEWRKVCDQEPQLCARYFSATIERRGKEMPLTVLEPLEQNAESWGRWNGCCLQAIDRATTDSEADPIWEYWWATCQNHKEQEAVRQLFAQVVDESKESMPLQCLAPITPEGDETAWRIWQEEFASRKGARKESKVWEEWRTTCERHAQNPWIQEHFLAACQASKDQLPPPFLMTPLESFEGERRQELWKGWVTASQETLNAHRSGEKGRQTLHCYIKQVFEGGERGPPEPQVLQDWLFNYSQIQEEGSLRRPSDTLHWFVPPPDLSEETKTRLLEKLKEGIEQLDETGKGEFFEELGRLPREWLQQTVSPIPPLTTSGVKSCLEKGRPVVVQRGGSDLSTIFEERERWKEVASNAVSAPLVPFEWRDDFIVTRKGRRRCNLLGWMEQEQTRRVAVSRSHFVPAAYAALQVTSRKETALNRKYEPGDAISNADGIFGAFCVTLGVAELRGFHFYDRGQGMALFAPDAAGRPQTRKVILSNVSQPDFELKDANKVMGLVAEASRDSVRGKSKCPEPLSPEKLQDDEARQKHDKEVAAYLVHHLTEDHQLPAVGKIKEANRLSLEDAITFLEAEIAKKGWNPKDLKGKFFKVTTSEYDEKTKQSYTQERLISLEVLFHTYFAQLSNEFTQLEGRCPDGYVYTVDPAAIFLWGLQENPMAPNPQVLHVCNRLQALAFKALEERMPLTNLKVIGWNDFNDPEIIEQMKKIFPQDSSKVEVRKKIGGEDAVMHAAEYRYNFEDRPYLLVLHNNGDGFGDNPKNEGANLQAPFPSHLEEEGKALRRFVCKELGAEDLGFIETGETDNNDLTRRYAFYQKLSERGYSQLMTATSLEILCAGSDGGLVMSSDAMRAQDLERSLIVEAKLN